MSKFLFASLLVYVLSSIIFSAPTVVVNSMYYEDIISGSAYAASMGWGYFFILTPSHADYVANFLSGAKDADVLYFESGWPVSDTLEGKLAPIKQSGRLTVSRSTSLAPIFASRMPKDSAIVVGREYGTEALSIAPYAALKGSAIFFADSNTADSIVASAKENYKSVLVYGSIASSLQGTQGVLAVNDGSIYADNIKAAQMFLDEQESAAEQVNLVSGLSFEKSMVSKDRPILFLERSSENAAASSFLAKNSIKTAIVYEGDSDISAAAASLKSKSGISIFAKLGEGFTGDAKVRDLAVLEIPSKPVYPMIVVNSKSYEDVVSGAAYASNGNYGYMFVLTPGHGDYIANYLSSSSGDIVYFEGANPVAPSFYQKISTLGSRVSHTKAPVLSDVFASKSATLGAVVVGMEIGAEALSIAPYAAAKGYPLLFASKASADSIVASAKAKYGTVLVYGSIASSLKSKEGLQIVDSGSIYADNLKAIEMYFATGQMPSQVALVSGRTFEKSMVSREYPILLAGRSSVYPDSARLLASRGVTRAVVFTGDTGVEGALASLKESSNISVFAKLGEGFTGDAKVRDLAVLGLPYAPLSLDLNGPTYAFGSKAFVLGVQNKGGAQAFVRVSVTLPSGQMASSNAVALNPGESKKISIPMDFGLGSSNAVESALFRVDYGTDRLMLDNSDTINYTNIQVAGQVQAQSPPPPSQAPKQTDSTLLLTAIAAVILAIGAYFFASGKKKK